MAKRFHFKPDPILGGWLHRSQHCQHCPVRCPHCVPSVDEGEDISGPDPFAEYYYEEGATVADLVALFARLPPDIKVLGSEGIITSVLVMPSYDSKVNNDPGFELPHIEIG